MQTIHPQLDVGKVALLPTPNQPNINSQINQIDSGFQQITPQQAFQPQQQVRYLF